MLNYIETEKSEKSVHITYKMLYNVVVNKIKEKEIMTNYELHNKLRKGMNVIDVIKKLKYLDQMYVIIKDVNDNEIDRYWYRPDCVHTERKSDNYKVLTVSITTEVSIIRFTQDPHVTLTVNNLK